MKKRAEPIVTANSALLASWLISNVRQKKMSQLPTPTSVALVARIVFETFEVTETEARGNAEGLVMLTEGWGGVGAVPADWALEVKKHFGGRLKWRSEATRQRFLDDKQATAVAYESYIRARK